MDFKLGHYPTSCILARYLAEQELACRRMERTANPDTPLGKEWNEIANMLKKKRFSHANHCERCEKGFSAEEVVKQW